MTVPAARSRIRRHGAAPPSALAGVLAMGSGCGSGRGAADEDEDEVEGAAIGAAYACHRPTRRPSTSARRCCLPWTGFTRHSLGRARGARCRDSRGSPSHRRRISGVLAHAGVRLRCILSADVTLDWTCPLVGALVSCRILGSEAADHRQVSPSHAALAPHAWRSGTSMCSPVYGPMDRLSGAQPSWPSLWGGQDDECRQRGQSWHPWPRSLYMHAWCPPNQLGHARGCWDPQRLSCFLTTDNLPPCIDDGLGFGSALAMPLDGRSEDLGKIYKADGGSFVWRR